ncbi:MAG: Methionyl-tRNA synthetase [Candidatus Gottesmanbacteria bacterium GW2011_GWC2_39_8]|uniref:Methionine--tRNA ligase n=1 Tax=Candidatus Gottesmanbacteria bacterium GW2011_GWC2_39_8 TaxID=1618450 RepID=A0A0G0Q7H8_9BACT|nr:MAG: Methionyl-tRNA synthetase [Candidatus Gottesmanbacteria bacterium GW2011_GWC2_39_8]
MKPTISIDDFAKIDFRVGKVVGAEEITESERLIKMLVDFGEEGQRTVFAGIKKFYKPSQLKDKKFIFVVNLLSRKMPGGESQGMMLAAVAENEVFIIPVNKKVKEGTIIR